MDKGRSSGLIERIARVKDKLDEVQKLLGVKGADPLLERIGLALLDEYKNIRQMEATEMQQKAEDEWIFFGDRCSKVFHKLLKAKRNKATVCEVKDKEGSLQKGQENIAKAFEDFLKAHLTLPCLS